MATALAPMKPATISHFLIFGGNECTVSLTMTCCEELQPPLPPFSIIFNIGFSVQAAVPTVALIKLDETFTIESMIWLIETSVFYDVTPIELARFNRFTANNSEYSASVGCLLSVISGVTFVATGRRAHGLISTRTLESKWWQLFLFLRSFRCVFPPLSTSVIDRFVR